MKHVRLLFALAYLFSYLPFIAEATQPVQGAASGSLANGMPTSLIAGQGFGFHCNSSDTTWYRLY